MLTALLLILSLGPWIIAWLRAQQIGQVIRDDGPPTHLCKADTPTMGGVLLVCAIVISTLLWSDWRNHYIWITILTVLAFASIGMLDDWNKMRLRHSRGMTARWKFGWQSLVALMIVGGFWSQISLPAETQLIVPFFKQFVIDLGWWFIPFAWLVLVSSANSLNVTDGLDGLAIVPSILIIGALGIFAYASGNKIIAHYLQIPYLPQAGEIVVFCAAVVGAGIGFLWFNTYPAQIFMGDVGSLALGSALGIVAVLVRQEIAFFIMSGVLVLEAASVILQVGSYKLFGKRIFRMAPLHHHFELQGISEPKLIVRFWIVTVIFVAIGLATLKIR